MGVSRWAASGRTMDFIWRERYQTGKCKQANEAKQEVEHDDT